MSRATESSRRRCPFRLSPVAFRQWAPTPTTARHSLLCRICPLLSTRATPHAVRTIGSHQLEMHISGVGCPSKLGHSYTRSGKNSARPGACLRAPHVLRVVVDPEMRAGRLPTREECGNRSATAGNGGRIWRRARRSGRAKRPACAVDSVHPVSLVALASALHWTFLKTMSPTERSIWPMAGVHVGTCGSTPHRAARS